MLLLPNACAAARRRRLTVAARRRAMRASETAVCYGVHLRNEGDPAASGVSAKRAKCTYSVRCMKQRLKAWRWYYIRGDATNRQSGR